MTGESYGDKSLPTMYCVTKFVPFMKMRRKKRVMTNNDEIHNKRPEEPSKIINPLS